MTNQKYRNILKWSLYALLFLLSMMVQTIVLGDVTVLGTKLSLLPVAVACVACQEDHEAGSLYALLCALGWTLSGAESGSVYLLMLPIAAAVGGYVCKAYLTRSLLPTAGASLLALCLCEGGVYLQRLYMGAALPPDALLLTAYQVGFSVLITPAYWLLARGICKVGGTHGT